MKRFNYEAISLILGLVKLIERDNLNCPDMDVCASNIINGEVYPRPETGHYSRKYDTPE